MPKQQPTPTSRARKAALLAATLGALLIASALSTGCEDSMKRRARAVMPDTAALRDVPRVLRNTIGSYVSVRGDRPLLVTGYGIVVGLDGTGSSDVPISVRDRLEREMGLRGVGQESKGMGWISPTEMLNDPNTAVVLVRAVIPPGSVEGARFDAMVTIAPGTSTTSIEGGRLWSTDLFKGQINPQGPVTEALASAAGPIFVNPFTDPNGEVSGFGAMTGRVLAGGSVNKPLDLVLLLDVPSFARARAITAAINSKFPRSRGDRDTSARGVSEDVIELHVPQRYANNPGEFLNLVMHTRLDNMVPQIASGLYARALKDQPHLATDLSWCMQALGRAALPSLRDLYDTPDAGPRLAALQAGARLQDALAAPHLKELAANGPASIRADAINLLAGMDADPRINLHLRQLIDADDVDIRVAAYEALVERNDPSISRRNVEDKFVLDLVPANEPMVYITQQNVPRIVLFGSNLTIETPTFISGWSSRLMLNAQYQTDELDVYYLDHITDESTTAAVSTNLADVVDFFAHETTPERPRPGLGLTYSQTVGALNEIAVAGALPAPFIAEQDVLAAELLHSIEGASVTERPEFEGDTGDVAPADPDNPDEMPSVVQFGVDQPNQTNPPAKRTFVVPIPPKSSRK